jgi:hypothetical protein
VPECILAGNATVSKDRSDQGTGEEVEEPVRGGPSIGSMADGRSEPMEEQNGRSDPNGCGDWNGRRPMCGRDR